MLQAWGSAQQAEAETVASEMVYLDAGTSLRIARTTSHLWRVCDGRLVQLREGGSTIITLVQPPIEVAKRLFSARKEAIDAGRRWLAKRLRESLGAKPRRR